MNTSQFLTHILKYMTAYHCICHVGRTIHVELIFYSTESLCYNLDSKFYFGNKG